MALFAMRRLAATLACAVGACAAAFAVCLFFVPAALASTPRWEGALLSPLGAPDLEHVPVAHVRRRARARSRVRASEVSGGGSGEAWSNPPEAAPTPPPPPFTPLPEGPPSAEELALDAASRTAYAGLGSEAAVALARRVFHIERPTWTAPGSEAGSRVTQYVSTHTATEERPSGGKVLVASSVPLRVADRFGHLSSVSLSLDEEESDFTPHNPVVPVAISKSVGGGATVPDGISVAPSEAATSAKPSLVGNTVMWGNTATDSDFMMRPLPSGIEALWQLRSEHSPNENTLVFHLPSEDRLQMSPTFPGAAEVVHGEQQIAFIPPAMAQQANGKSLPLSYSVSGDTLTISVNLEGPVDFPVLVDPTVEGFYGGAYHQSWPYWNRYEAGCTGCYKLGEYALSGGGDGLWSWGNQTSASKTYGLWYIWPGRANAPITRVDLTNAGHSGTATTFAAGLYKLSPPPTGGEYLTEKDRSVVTENGTDPSKTRPAPRVTTANFTSPLAFCAVGAGGYDGGAQPLCEEREGAPGFVFELFRENGGPQGFYSAIESAAVKFTQKEAPRISSIEGLTTGWFNSQGKQVRITGGDPGGVGVTGIGIDAVGPPRGQDIGEWKQLPQPSGTAPAPGIAPYHPACNDPFCEEWASMPASLAGLSTGVWALGAWVHDAVEQQTEELTKVYVDNTAPAVEAPSWSGQTFGQGAHVLNFTVGDGSTGSPQSGLAIAVLTVDGRPVAVQKPPAACENPKGIQPSAACYTITGSYTLNSEAWGSGPHEVAIYAKDWAGNESSQKYTVTIELPINETEQVGPGELNLLSGDYRLSDTDVSFPSGNATLTVARSYDSHAALTGSSGDPGAGSGCPAQSATSPLGPGWTLSTPDTSAAGQWQCLEALSNGSVEARTTNGRKALFALQGNGSGYTSPPGFQTFKLTVRQSGPGTVYQITDAAGDYTQFEQVAGTNVFVPSVVGQAAGLGGINSVRYLLNSQGEASEIVGPDLGKPQTAGFVSCKGKPLETKGCRTLVLAYAPAGTTPPSGEGASEWGDYAGRLKEISFTAWDPQQGGMTTIAVAHYAYDKQGRLRAEWDPRVEHSPDCGGSCAALKTTYGYDAQNRITALTPAGEQPFLLSYGTTAGAIGESWLLSVTRPAASVASGNGKAPANTKPPTLSSQTAAVGTTLKVQSNGTWSNNPLAYGYQWQRCTSAGWPPVESCQPIAGATNQTYTPQPNDQGAFLVAQVTANNATAAVTANAVKTAPVEGSSSTNNPIPPAPKPGKSAITTIEYHVPASGTGVQGSVAPYKMGATEVGKWAQAQIPAEAAAIFPPDEVQGWPANSYKRASVYYFDVHARRVNEAAPTERISTTEYDSWGNVVRSLTPGNRTAALHRSWSAAVAVELDTQNAYSEDGTELISSLGPSHLVRLGQGGESLVRAHASYHYDEGAPEGGFYGLVTKTTEGAVSGCATLPCQGSDKDPRTITTDYSGGQEGLGWKLHKPTSVTSELGPGKTSTRRTVYDQTTGDVLESSSPGASGEPQPPLYSLQFGSAGKQAGQLQAPKGVALDSSDNVWVADSANNRLQEFSPSGSFVRAVGWGVADGKGEPETCTSTCGAGIAGAGAGQLSGPEGVTVNRVSGNVYVSDTANNRVAEFSPAGAFVRAFGWGVLDGKNEAETCTTTCTTGIFGGWNGQLNSPQGLTSDSNGRIWVANRGARLQAFNAEGGFVTKIEHVDNGEGRLMDVTFCGSGNSAGTLYVTDRGVEGVVELSTSGAHLGAFGSWGSGDGQFREISRIACDPGNNELYVTDEAGNRIEIFTSSGEFAGAFGSSGTGDGQLTSPIGVAVGASGVTYAADGGNDRVEVWKPSNPGAHTTVTTYYSAEPKVGECNSHPEWAGLPCRTVLAAQPQDALGNVPSTTTTYDIWDQPLTVTRRIGGATRVAAASYDPAGRPLGAATESAQGRAVPAETNEYSKQSGALIAQSATIEGTKRTSTSTYDLLGQLTAYTDGAGSSSTSTYAYDVDGRPTKAFDGKGEQTYVYDATTGTPKTLKDKDAGTFTATYDPEGRIEEQKYPNGMKATYEYNSTGQATSVSYTKGTAKWYEDSVVPTINGQWATQVSTLGSEAYSYDALGRLIETGETPQGKGCTVSLYAYDGDSNRTSETTRKPASEGACASSGGASVNHAYDSADRLADPGVQYELFGGATVLPEGDSGGKALETAYYADGSLYTQAQGGQVNTYILDPAGRTLETKAETISGFKATISHYAGPGSTPAWTEEGANFNRKVIGLDGSLSGVQTASGTAGVTLQISNLHGDIVGTVEDVSTAKPKLSESEPTAFGIPTSAQSSPYGWLGSGGVQSEFEGGATGGGGGAYVPQLGISLGPEELSASALQDPVNEYLENQTQAMPISGGTSNLPGAVEPLPVNQQEMEAFWADPPWDQKPEDTGYRLNIAGLVDCSGGCHETPAQKMCLKKAGNNKSRGSKCFGHQHGHFKELFEPIKIIVGIVKCAYEIVKPPHVAKCERF